MPSRKKGGGNDTLGTELSGGVRERGGEKRVLKKQRRVSGGGLTSGPISTVNTIPSPTDTNTNTNVVTRTSGV